jgi:ABC-type Mn2+/Zn2+ transport system ATPase subunit
METDFASGLLLSRARVRVGGRNSKPLDSAVPCGSWCEVRGPNGSGKTTLLYALAGLRPLRAERAALHGSALRKARADGRVVLVTDRPSIGQSVSAKQWLASVGLRCGVSRSEIAQSAELWGVDSYWHRRDASLSGGMRLRCTLAAAFARGGDLFLLDEVRSALDASAREMLDRCIEEATGQGGIVMEVTHDLARPDGAQIGLDVRWLG